MRSGLIKGTPESVQLRTYSLTTFSNCLYINVLNDFSEDSLMSIIPSFLCPRLYSSWVIVINNFIFSLRLLSYSNSDRQQSKVKASDPLNTKFLITYFNH